MRAPARSWGAQGLGAPPARPRAPRLAPAGAPERSGQGRRRARAPATAYGALGGLQLSLPLPVGSYRLTSAFGPRTNPVTGQHQSEHNGQDMAAPTGTPVYAAAGGVVAKVYDNHPVNGNAVILGHADTRITGTAYLHLSEVNVRTGQVVRVGQQIGRVGSTGRSTGPHLHFIVYALGKAVDPTEYLRDARPRVAPPAGGASSPLWPWLLAFGAVAVGAGTFLVSRRRPRVELAPPSRMAA